MQKKRRILMQRRKTKHLVAQRWRKKRNRLVGIFKRLKCLHIILNN